MSTVAIAVLRARAAARALLSFALIVIVTVIALGTSTGLIRDGVATGGRETLAAAEAQSSAVRITARLADDSAQQDSAAINLFDRLFPERTVAVTSSAFSEAVPVLAGSATGSTVLFARLPDLGDRVVFTQGSWPATREDGVAPVAVQADAAAALSLEVGDELTVGTTGTPLLLRVEALWRASDPTAGYWFADSAATAGRSGGSDGLFVLDETAFASLPTQLSAAWTLTALPGAADDSRRDAVIAGLARLPDEMESTASLSGASATVSGGLVGTLERIDAAGRGATAIGISGIVVVGMLGIVALLQVSTVLVGSRREQTGLLRARGLSRGQLATLTAGEALLVAVPASALGLAASTALLTATTGGEPVRFAVAALPYALGVCAASAALLVVLLVSDRHAPARGIGPFAVGFGAVATCAALAVWQLQAQGSPVPRSGAGGVDIVSAAAPALALLAACSLGTLAFVAVTPAIARRAERRGSTISLLATGQLAGHATRYLVPILAVSITIASAAFASGIATTWQSAQVRAQFIGTGAAVEVALRSDDTAPPDTEPVTALRYSDLDGARAASALVISRVRIGTDAFPLVAIDPESARQVLGDGGTGFVDALLRSHTPDGGSDDGASGLPLPPSATGVQTTLSTTGGAPVSRFAVSVWAADADGSLARIPLVDETAGDTAGTSEVALRSGVLPPGTAPWRILAVEAERSGPGDAAVPTLTASGLASVIDGVATPLANDVEVELAVSGTLPTSRAAITPRDAAALPVVLTAALADRIGLRVGDSFAVGFGVSGSPADASVTAIVPAVPGAGSRLGIAADIADLNDVALQQGRTPLLASDVWIDTGRPDAVSLAATGVATSTAVVSTQRSSGSAAILQPAMDAFWLAAAAAGVLALIALAAFVVEDSRARRQGLAVLRALGLSSAQRTAVRARELLVALAFALVIGVLGGVLSTVAAVTPFVAASVPEAGGSVSVPPTLDPLPWMVFTAALLAAAVVVAALSLVLVRADRHRGGSRVSS